MSATHTYDIELTDTFAGEANYSWVKRAVVTMPEITHYGYDGSAKSYARVSPIFDRELMKAAKAKMGLTGVRGVKHAMGDDIEFRPYGMCQVMFINYRSA